MAGPLLFRPSNIPTGLQGYWKLDEASGNRSDSSANGNTLTDVNTVGNVAYDYWNTGENSALFVRSSQEALTITDGSQTGLDMTGSFSFCGWVKFTTLTGPSEQYILTKYSGAGGEGGYIFSLNSSNNWEFTVRGGTGSTQNIATGPSVGRWYHFACVHDDAADTINLYIDGNLVDVDVHTGGSLGSSTDFYLGRRYDNTTGFDLNATLKDVAIWNVVLTPIQVKSLAMGVDLSVNAYRPTNADTQPTHYWKMNYVATTIGASESDYGSGTPLILSDALGSPSREGYVEGSGRNFRASDYFSAVDSDDWNFGTGDFTIAHWTKFDTVSHQGFCVQAASNPSRWAWRLDTGIALNVYDGSGAVNVSAPWVPVANTWYHLCVKRASGKWAILVDGKRIAITTETNGTMPDVAASLVVGANYSSGLTNFFDGVLTDFAIWKGYALSDDEVKLLASAFPIQQTGIVSYWKMEEERAAKIATRSGSAQIDTAQSKFGGASGLFNGTTDYVTVTSDSAIEETSGTVDLTIDLWVRFNATGGSQAIIDRGSTGNLGLLLVSGTLHWYTGAVSRASYAWSPSTATWYHIALVRLSGRAYMYIDGSLVASGADSYNIPYTNQLTVGAYTGGGNYFNGWLDEIRISKGARWTGNFTSPTSAYVTDDQTILLLHCDGADGSPTFTDSSASGAGTAASHADEIGSNTLTTTNSPYQTVGMVGTGANFESGGSQYASIADGSQTGLDVAQNMITLMCWIKPESIGEYSMIDKSGFTTGYGIVIASSKPNLTIANNYIDVTATTLTAGTWYHVVGIYDAATKYLYLNSVVDGSETNTHTIDGGANSFYVGSAISTRYFDGVIDEALVAARYFRTEEIKTAYINGLNEKDITFEPVSGNTGGFFLVF